MTSYRYPNEQWILILTVGFLLVIALLVGGPTLCLLPLIVLIFVVLAYLMNQSQHQALIRQAQEVTQERAPEMYALVQRLKRRVKPGEVQVYMAGSRQLNAYTFGLESPQVIVLYSALFHVMDEDELSFILGHEMGHVALGHTWLNTLLGGMAGVPVGFGGAVILVLAFRWWNRACEYSADRAGLLACGKPAKAISALVKLVARDADTQAELERALAAVEKEDDEPMNMLAETLATHPMIGNRIEEIRKFAASDQYRQLIHQMQ